MFNEFEFENKMQKILEREFHDTVTQIDNSLYIQYTAMKWKYIKTARRTVIFPFESRKVFSLFKWFSIYGCNAIYKNEL